MSPVRKSKYPAGWYHIAGRVKTVADWRCEACGQRHDDWTTGTILTVHHLDGDPMNPPGMPSLIPHDNLIALCQSCHLRAEPWSRAGEVLTRDECIERLQAILEELSRQYELELPGAL